MALGITCRKCGRVGLVRKERVITGREGKEVFYCGACEFEWQEVLPRTKIRSEKRAIVSAAGTVAWASAFADYRIRCEFTWNPDNTCTIAIVENGVELQREHFTPRGANVWNAPWQRAITLQSKYYPRLLQAWKDRFQPRG
jgi:hypothetical protein